MAEKADPYEIITKVVAAGIKNFTAHKIEVQDGVVVCMTIRIEDKETKITR